MKSLYIPKIESCTQCPFAAYAEFKVESSKASVRYCKRMGVVTSAPTPLAMLEKFASFAVGSDIPNWCPLENANEPAISDGGQLTLQQFIDLLRSQTPWHTLSVGIANPHSYKGWHDRLAFERLQLPAGHFQLVCAALNVAESALHMSFPGNKGGSYTMLPDTLIYLANRGESGEEITDEMVKGWFQK